MYRVVQDNGVDPAFESAKLSKPKAEQMLDSVLAANARAVKQYTDQSLPVPPRVAGYKATIRKA